jgi:fatty acid desaturase
MDENFSGAIDKAALKALSRPSDAKGLAQLAAHLWALGLSGALVVAASGTGWLAPAWLLHGLLLVFLFAPLHETVHRTAFARRGLNDAVAWGCGLVLALPPAYFRAYHFAHHRHTQDPARDPELASAKPDTWAAYLLHASGLPYWRRQATSILAHAAGRVDEPFIAPAARATVVREARTVLGIYAAIAVVSVAAGSTLALTLWVVPVALGQPFLRLYLLAEHTGCPLIADMFRNTRTTRTNWLVRRLAWNMPYHTEHHAYPAVPFHALPGAHEVLRERLAVVAPGYISVHRDIVAGFRRRPSVVGP